MIETITIRELSAEHAATYVTFLARLEKERGHSHFDQSELPDAEMLAYGLEDNAEAGGWTLGLEDESALVGHLQLIRGRQRIDHHVGVILVELLQGWTGKGWGRKMLEQTEARAEAAGILRLELTVLADNLSAIKLYRRLGFKEEGRKVQARKLGGAYVDEILMAKLLRPGSGPPSAPQPDAHRD